MYTKQKNLSSSELTMKIAIDTKSLINMYLVNDFRGSNIIKICYEIIYYIPKGILCNIW